MQKCNKEAAAEEKDMTKLTKILLLFLHFVNDCYMLETRLNSKCRSILVEKPFSLLPASNSRLYANSRKHSHVERFELRSMQISFLDFEQNSILG
jgi:hypothetical protein